MYTTIVHNLYTGISKFISRVYSTSYRTRPTIVPFVIIKVHYHRRSQKIRETKSVQESNRKDSNLSWTEESCTKSIDFILYNLKFSTNIFFPGQKRVSPSKRRIYTLSNACESNRASRCFTEILVRTRTIVRHGYVLVIVHIVYRDLETTI